MYQHDSSTHEFQTLTTYAAQPLSSGAVSKPQSCFLIKKLWEQGYSSCYMNIHAHVDLNTLYTQVCTHTHIHMHMHLQSHIYLDTHMGLNRVIGFVLLPEENTSCPTALNHCYLWAKHGVEALQPPKHCPTLCGYKEVLTPQECPVSCWWPMPSSLHLCFFRKPSHSICHTFILLSKEPPIYTPVYQPAQLHTPVPSMVAPWVLACLTSFLDIPSWPSAPLPASEDVPSLLPRGVSIS